MKKVFYLFVILTVVVECGYAQYPIETSINAKPIQPALDENLRHAQVLLASDGFYYMTGTTSGDDWQYSNKSIKIWKSSDLKDWEALGEVWNITEDKFWRALGWGIEGTFHSKLAKAVRAPEIHEKNGNFYLVYSVSFGGIAILKSKSNKPEGPYESHAKLTDFGFDPSLFTTDEGKTYLVFNGGFIGLLNEDLTALQVHPKYIYPEINPPKGWGMATIMDRVGTKGAHIFMKDGKYHLVAADKQQRLADYTHDLFIAVSDGDIYGPYHRRYMAVTHSDHSTVFEDKQGKWWATYSGNPNDDFAMFTGKTGLVPLREYESKGKTYIGVSTDVILEKGRIGSMHPIQSLKDQFSRDPSICIGHDGAYYMTCTISRESNQPDGGLKVWRSEDLVNWEDLGYVWTWKDDATWHTNRERTDKRMEGIWAPEIAYINGKYYIAYSLNRIPRVTALIESKKNKPEGPYRDPVGEKISDGIDGFLYEDEDGSIYYLWGGGQIAKMKPDMSGFDGEPWEILADGNVKMGYEGCGVIKHKGKYIITASDWIGDHNGSYNLMYCTADKITGPYSERKLAIPHAGHATVFRGTDGKLYSTVFGSDATNPFHNRMGLVEIEITDDFEFKVLDTAVGY